MDIVEIFTSIMKFSIKGTLTFPSDFVLSIIEFLTIVLNTSRLVITNPYIGAKAIELIQIFMILDKKA